MSSKNTNILYDLKIDIYKNMSVSSLKGES